MNGAARHPGRLGWAHGLALVIILAAFGLRLWHLNSEPVWHDEGWSIRAIRGPFTTPDDNTPFLYYLTGHLLWRAGTGESALALRYVSLLIGVVTAAAALRIGWRWYGPLVGLTAGALVAGSPLLWEYSQEVRAYVAVPLIALLLLACADAILRHRPGQRVPPRLWWAMFAVQLAGLYTHNLAVPLVVWVNVALGGVWLLRRDWRAMFAWAGVQTALMVCYIPWLLTQSPSGTPLNTPPRPGLALIRDIWLSYFLPSLAQFQDAFVRARQGVDVVSPITLYGMFLLLLLVLGTYSLRRGASARAARRGWLLLTQALLVPVFTVALMLAAHIDFHPRYFIAAVPATMLLIARGSLLWRGAFIRFRVSMYTLAVFTPLMFAFISLDQITRTRAYQHDDFAGLAAYYAALPDDAVILIPFNDEPALQNYYADHMGIGARFVNVPLYAGEEAALAVISDLTDDLAPGQTRHIEFLTWFQLPADARGMYPCLLGAASARVGDAITFYGLMTQAYILSGPVDFQTLPAAPRYRQLALVSAAYAAGESGICVRTDWTLQQAAHEDINAAAALLNPLGGELSRVDAPLARPDNAGTSHWRAPESGQAYHLLRLPPGAPPLDYGLSLNVYSAAQASGFDLLDEAGNPSGKTYTLQEVIRAQGPPLARDVSAPEVLDSSPDAFEIQTGVPLDITLLLPAGARRVTLAGDDGWQIEQAAQNGADAGLSWHRFVVMPGSAGEALLSVDGAAVAPYFVDDVPRTFEAPDYTIHTGITFPGIALLAGVNAGPRIMSAEPFTVELIWRAEATPDTAYTVFVQLFSEDGHLLAQSDSAPSGGSRPTTSWLAGEYVTDVHTLRWNIAGYSGPTYLIAGFYDADFVRARTLSGLPQARIPGTLEVVR